MIKDVEKNILMWLKEEKLSPERLEEPNAFFNIKIKLVNNLFLHVNQNINFTDSLTVTCSLIYTPDQLTLLNERMDAGSKREYFNKILTELTLHPYIWDFHIDPDKGVIMHSKRLYYHNLTKDNLMHLVYLMAKMFKLPIRLIDDYFQEFWPEWKSKDDPELEKMR